MSNPQARPEAIAPHVLRRVVGDLLVLFDTRSQKTYSLEGVGRRITELLDTSSTEPAIVDVLAEEYDVERVRLEGDVAVFLAELRSSGLISSGVP